MSIDDWSRREWSRVSTSLAALNLNVCALIVSRLSRLFYLIYKVIEFHSVIFLWREYTISRGISTICTLKELHPAINRLHRCFNKQKMQLFPRSFSKSVTFQSKLEERKWFGNQTRANSFCFFLCQHCIFSLKLSSISRSNCLIHLKQSDSRNTF